MGYTPIVHGFPPPLADSLRTELFQLLTSTITRHVVGSFFQKQQGPCSLFIFCGQCGTKFEQKLCFPLYISSQSFYLENRTSGRRYAKADMERKDCETIEAKE